MNILFTIIEAIAPGIVVGIVMACWNRNQNKKASAATAKEQAARKKDELVISLLVATADLSYASVMALKRGSPNGEVEVALERYSKAMQRFREFERQQLWNID